MVRQRSRHGESGTHEYRCRRAEERDHHPGIKITARALGLSILGAIVGVGCGCSGPTAEGSSIGIAEYEEFRPFVAPPADATLTLAAVPIQVSLLAVESGNKLTIDLKHEDRLVDREIYAHIGDSVCLVHAAGENFDPPLPLLTFPMKIGRSWNWKGVTTLESAASPATAAVRTSVSKVAILEVMENAVEVDVDLEMNSDSPVKQKRNLKLWFVNGRGLVKRSFGEESVREPR